MAREEHPVNVLEAPTPLHAAAEAGDAATVAILIKNGQDPNSRAKWPNYENGATPLHLAAQRGHLEVVLALLNAGAEPRGCVTVSQYRGVDLTPLHEASARGHVEVVRALLSAGGNPDCIASGIKVGKLRVGRCDHQVFSEWDGGHTPLHLASAFGRVDVVRALVESGASIGARGGDNDDTPLHFAALCGRVDAMSVLIESGADIDAGDNSGNTALHVAADVSSTELLLAAGANPSLVAESPYGSCTPLGSYCTLIHRLETAREGVQNATSQVKALLHHGADTRLRASRDYKGKKSPILSCAAKNGVPGIVSALLEAGLDPNERDQEGWAPLHDAARGDHVEVVRLLLRAGAGIDVRTVREGWTPLHIASRFTSVDCVLELLKKGGDLNATDDGYPHDGDRLTSRPIGRRRPRASKVPGKTPAEVIGLRHRVAAPLVKGGSADPSQDEDEQMEVFDEDTGWPDTGASARNAIRRALCREASWRRRRGVILLKAYFDRQNFAASSSQVVNAIAGVGDLEPASSAVGNGERGWNVPVRPFELDAARAQYGGAKRRRSGGVGIVKDEAPLLHLLKGVLDLACCEELFQQIVMLL